MTVLTAVMICGLLVIVGLFVTRLGRTPPVAPATLSLPPGAEARAYTEGTDWVAVVTTDDQTFIFDRATGALRQTVTID